MAYVDSAAAQEAVATIAFNAEESLEMRLARSRALAESASRNGAKLGEKSVETLIEIAKSESDLTLRIGASQAAGDESSGQPGRRHHPRPARRLAVQEERD